MKIKMSKPYIYILMILLSITFGIVRYLMYNEEGFSLFHKKEKMNNINIEQFKSIFDEVRYNMAESKVFHSYNEEVRNYIDFEKAQLYSENKMAVFIDARSADEVEQYQVAINNEIIKTIPSAIIIPVEDIEVIYNETEYFYGNLSKDELELLKIDYENEMKSLGYLKTLPTDINYIIYCGSNLCDKSHRLADIMHELLFEKVGLYKNGWEDWVFYKYND